MAHFCPPEDPDLIYLPLLQATVKTTGMFERLQLLQLGTQHTLISFAKYHNTVVPNFQRLN